MHLSSVWEDVSGGEGAQVRRLSTGDRPPVCSLRFKLQNSGVWGVRCGRGGTGLPPLSSSLGRGVCGLGFGACGYCLGVQGARVWG